MSLTHTQEPKPSDSFLKTEFASALESIAAQRGEGVYCPVVTVDKLGNVSWTTVDISKMVEPSQK